MIGSGISSSRLVGRVPEHHPLVARADLVERVVVAGVVLYLVGRVDALRDVRRLLVERDDHAARVRVEAVLRAVVADLADLLADEPRDVDVGLGRDLARDDDETGGDERLAGDAPLRVVREDGVEDRVRDLVGHLVGMALGHRLGGEEECALSHVGREGYRTATDPLTVRTEPSTDAQSIPFPSGASPSCGFAPASVCSSGSARWTSA